MKRLIALLTALMSISLFGAFKYETTLTVTGYAADETLANFPLLVRISPDRISGFDYKNCQSNGIDIAFYSADGKITYPHEIDEWNVGSESLVWVKIPALTQGMTFKMRFGDTTIEAAPAYSTDGSVWKGADYFAVYHLGETENIGTSSFRAADSSGNEKTMSPVIQSHASGIKTLTEGCLSSQPAGVGRGVQTYSSDDVTNKKRAYLEAAYGPVANESEFTLSGWVKIVQYISNQAQLFSRKNTYNDTTGWSFMTASTTKWTMYGSGNWQHTCGINVGTVVDKLVHMTVIYSGETVSVYIDGVLKGSGAIPTVVAGNQKFRIGGTGYDWNDKTPLVADEIRLRNGSSSAAWIQTDCDSQTNLNYIAFSPVEELLVSGNTITITATPTERTGEGVTYGTDQPITPGEVTFTAPAEMQEDDDGFYRFSGWNLTIYGSDGSTTKSSGVGNVCSFNHKNGDTAKLEWVITQMFKVTVKSADETRGSVTGDGYYDAGSDATITATATAGNSFVKWLSADLPSASVYDKTVTFAVNKAMTIQGQFSGKQYAWKTAAGGNWADAGNWTDSEIPPNDGTADVVFPSGTARYVVKLPATGTISVRSLNVKAPTTSASNNAVALNAGNLSVGAGGLSFDDTGYSCGFEFQQLALTIAVSQNWLISSANNGTSLYFNGGSVTVPEGVVWTIAGKSVIYDNGASFANMKGTLRTNSSFNFYGGNPLAEVSAPGKIEFFDGSDPIAGVSSPGYNGFEAKSSNVTVVASAPISLDIESKTLELAFSRSCYIADNAWRYRITSPISGGVANKKFVLSQGKNTTLTHFPFKQYMTLEGDNSNLSVANDGAIGLSQGVFVLKNENSLGANNAFNVYFGNSQYGGYLTGILTTNGINVTGNLELSSKNSHVTLGMVGAGSTTFSGNITESSVAQLHFDAPKGATVNVKGNIDISLAKSKSAIVNGGGTVVLLGDNASMNQQGVVIRGGTTVLAHNNAAGTKAISLGGAVPNVTTVRSLLDTELNYAGGSWQYYGNQMAQGKITKNLPFKIDGLEMKEGDVFAHSPCATGNGKIYRMTSDSTFEAVSDVTYAEGLRIKVTEGADFGGKAVYLVSADATAGGTALEDGVDPDVAVLASKGVTIANEINVTDNKSAGKSMIGVADDSSVMFSGKITLNRAVTFYAAAGGTATFTGEIADVEGQTNSVSVAGAGTVVLKTLDWKGRTLDLSNFDTAELEAANLRRVKLLSAKGVGEATVLKPTNTGKWSISVLRDSVMASKGGMTVIVR